MQNENLEHHAASDLDLHCLPMSHLKDARLKLATISRTIKGFYCSFQGLQKYEI